jgi:hypothetical protein
MRREGTMESLEFVGVDPNTPQGNSPTVWVDPQAREIVIQGWTAGEELRQKVHGCPAPDHAPGIPTGEDVVRLPARMAEILRKAADAADRLG